MLGSRRTSIIESAILTVAMRWLDRLIGFISTLILARLLLPEDFGVTAMAMLVIGLIDVFLDFGVNIALIQNHKATQEHYDTAWTLRLIQSIITTLIIFAIAPSAAIYFNDPRIEPVLYVMTLSILLTGLENIGTISFQKEMRFGLDFRFTLTKRMVSFFVTIIAAWLMTNYWSLVIGTIIGRATGVIISYSIHPMRPCLSFAKIKEIFSVSLWMLIRSIGIYLDSNLHKILVGRRADTTTLGGYTLADEISSLPTTELLAPINRALFPAYVEAKNNPIELKRLFLLSQGLQSLIAIPASVGLALIAHEAVIILLGEKWLIAIPFIQLLALTKIADAITTSASYVLITLNHFRGTAILIWTRVVLFVIGAFLFIPISNALQIAWLRLIIVFISFWLILQFLIRVMDNIKLLDIIKTISRPLLSACVMAAVIISLDDFIDTNIFLLFVIKIAVGFLTYSSTIILLWRITGKPIGPESYLIEKLKPFFKKIAGVSK